MDFHTEIPETFACHGYSRQSRLSVMLFLHPKSPTCCTAYLRFRGTAIGADCAGGDSRVGRRLIPRHYGRMPAESAQSLKTLFESVMAVLGSQRTSCSDSCECYGRRDEKQVELLPETITALGITKH